MRKIKFRAWDNREHLKKMFTDFLVSNDGVFFVNVCLGHISTPFTINNKDVVIMQYTGLKDKDGTEIFEGDIIEAVGGKSGMLYCGAVTWMKNTARFSALIEGELVATILVTGRMQEGLAKVVGNIYENPELLGESNDTA